MSQAAALGWAGNALYRHLNPDLDRRGVGKQTDEDMLHAFNHPIRAEDLDNDMTMLVGPDRAANLLEVGAVTGRPDR